MHLHLAEIDEELEELKGFIFILELARCIQVYFKKNKKISQMLKVVLFSGRKRFSKGFIIILELLRNIQIWGKQKNQSDVKGGCFLRHKQFLLLDINFQQQCFIYVLTPEIFKGQRAKTESKVSNPPAGRSEFSLFW